MKRILAPVLLLTLLFPSLALGGEVTIPENSFSQVRTGIATTGLRQIG